jgi:uncharacterized protein YndB with AHSA1/START domain
MANPEFVYTTYIETTVEKLWQALTAGDFTVRYWFGYRVASDWKAGSTYKFEKAGANSIEGKVISVDPPRRLVYSWESCSPEAKDERPSRVTFMLEPRGKSVKLVVTHDELEEGGRTIRDISGGWPMVLASLKSLLETGHGLEIAPPSAAGQEAACAAASA